MSTDPVDTAIIRARFMAIGGLALCAWFALVIITMEILPTQVSAHGLAATAVGAWEFTPLVVVPLVVTAVLYAAGLLRLWRRAWFGRGISRWAATSFAA